MNSASTEDPKEYVETILQVHAKYQKLVDEAFKNEATFVAALDKVRRGARVREMKNGARFDLHSLSISLSLSLRPAASLRMRMR